MSIYRYTILRALTLVCCGTAASRECVGADLKDIIQRANAALNADWAADTAYACVERDETRKGEKVTSKTFESLMVEGSEYRFSLAVDDKPLTEDKQRAEFIKFRNEVNHRRSESAAARRTRIDSWKKRRDEDGELLLDFPSALSFQLLREDVKDGHPVLVLSASPKQGLVPATRAAKVLAGMQGTAWVEKETMHPIRVECTVVSAVAVFGALASVLPGTEIEINMAPVTPGIWLISEVSMKLSVAKLHMFRSTDITRSTYTEYRPNAAVLQELLAKASQF